jgi:hypothetical protein
MDSSKYEVLDIRAKDWYDAHRELGDEWGGLHAMFVAYAAIRRAEEHDLTFDEWLEVVPLVEIPRLTKLVGDAFEVADSDPS